jgi:hypothetical protein
MTQLTEAYAAVAGSLKEFGYPDVTTEMIREIHDAIKAEAPLPHGVIGRFARDQIEEYASLFTDDA